MHGLWVGPLKVSEFMDAFMKTTKRLPRSRLAKVKFTSVPTISASEHDMSHSFIDVVGKHGLLPSGWVLRETMGDGKAKKKDEPRMLLCNEEPGASGSHWKSAEMWIDINRTAEMDAFRTDVEDLSTSLDDVTEDAKRTRRRITSYTTTQLARQHRTSTLSLLICGHHARFIRWDRSGAVVSHHFDYCAEPLPLAESFWRYGRLSRAERGFDTTARLATCIEESRLHAAISTHLFDPMKRKIPKMERSMAFDFPAHVISFTSPDGSTQGYVVQRPFSPPDAPAGRSTRAYIALDLASDELVFLKDYWRPLDDIRLPEAEIYAALHDAQLPHLPRVRCGGDVSSADVTAPHSTVSHIWKDSQRFCAHGVLKEYIQHRIVQDLAYPLTAVNNSRELVAAVRNGLECILYAHRNGWMHRDFSTGNMMLNAEGHGILNDWDHGFKIDPDHQVQPPRTGTWQFLSILLQDDPKKVHDVLDDIESCYWVLLYCALHHFDSTADHRVLEMFDYRDDETGDMDMRGGAKKMHFLIKYSKVIFSCPPLQDLTEGLRVYFRFFHGGRSLNDADVVGRAILALFDAALSRQDWAASDVLPDRFPRQQRYAMATPAPTTQFTQMSDPPLPPTALKSSKQTGKRLRGDGRDRALHESSDEYTTQSSKRQRTEAESSGNPVRRIRVGRSCKPKSLEALGSRRTTRSQTRSAQRLTRSQSKRLLLSKS
ncbi:hypothetical protein BXZ70DRAFT_216639 [Cristinia sonorae]|uniref:Fungal-type protein kinase domain-containing protein n=1 Tax=Cristinia sonorae TaxID=1940300 RepID=A0A8K0XP66_9AGAR|nr:hypothetical protein BXZ70DRAFT_216639 [Cristinia sonorae]